MDKVRIPVDFNEMVDADTVMLSQSDTTADFEGNPVVLYEGMPVALYEEDVYEDGEADYLTAEGVVIRHDPEAYPFFLHVKWFCRIDARGIQSLPEPPPSTRRKPPDAPAVSCSPSR